jgi:ketosteroid isomerase-like protein
MKWQPRNYGRIVPLLAVAAALLLGVASPVSAQKEKKKKKNAPASATGQIIPMEDQQQIDYQISQMLGAWQVGDIEKLHSFYADDVSIVNGAWAPPVLGWNNYLALYQQARTRMQQVRLDRDNSYIKVSGNVAWACYQWEFSAVSGDQPTASRGQTTLIFEKRNNRWLIVHNHTSLIETAHQAQDAPRTLPPQPVQQPSPAKP